MDKPGYGFLLWIAVAFLFQGVTIGSLTSVPPLTTSTTTTTTTTAGGDEKPKQHQPSLVAVVNGRQVSLKDYQLIVGKGDDLSLTCSSNQPLEWEFFPHDPEVSVPGHTIKENETQQKQGETTIYLKTLVISNAQWFDTLLYKCVEYSSAEYTENELFLFVKDPQQPFQAHDKRRPQLVDMVPFGVFCGVTDPSLHVDLVANGTIVSNHDNVQWNPKWGFTVNILNERYPDYFLNVTCRTTTSNGQEKSLYFTALDARPAVPKVPPKINVYINGKSATLTDDTLLVAKGDTFKLECHGVSKLEWRWSGGNLQNDVGNVLEERGGGKPVENRTLMSSLTIKGAKTENAGTYQCTQPFSYHPDGEIVSVIVGYLEKLVANDPPKLSAFVNKQAVSITDGDLKVTNGDDVKLVCTGKTRVSWNWKPITEPMGDSKLEVKYEPSNKMKVLVITKAHFFMSRNYTCLSKQGFVAVNIFVKVSEDDKSSPPQILFLNDTIRISKGDNLTVGCKGREPIEWKWDASKINLQDSVPGNEIQVSEDNLDPAHYYVSYLEIYNAQWFNTMEFRCEYALDQSNTNEAVGGYGLVQIKAPSPETTLATQKKESSSVFVFVADPEEPFQDFGFIWLILKYNYPLKIPCGVTDPNLRVDLYANRHKKTDDTGVLWDPKEGFTVLYPTYDFLSQVFCNVTTSVTYEERTIPFMTSGDDGQPPIPHLEASQYSLIVGASLKLTCWVNVLPDHVLYLDFHYKKKGNDRFIENVTQRNSSVYSDMILRYLNIQNVQVNDTGLYTCISARTIQAEPEKFKNTSVLINVYGTPFIHLKPMSDVVKAYESDRATMLAASFFAVPPPTFEWYFAGVKLKKGFPIDWSQTDKWAKLIISYPKTENSGLYKVRAYNKLSNGSIANQREASIMLEVHGKPTVNIGATSADAGLPDMVFTEGANELAKFTCTARGYPKSEVTWFFQPCQTRQCNISESRWTDIMDYDEMAPVLKVGGEMTHYLHIQTKMSGYLMCFANNSNGNQSEYLKFIVTDHQGSLFTYSNATRKVTVGDAIEVTCAANKWLYSSVELRAFGSTPLRNVHHIKAMSDESKASDEPSSVTKMTTDSSEAILDSGVNFTSTSTTPAVITYPHLVRHESEYSIQVTMVFDKLKEIDEGSYHCEATSTIYDVIHSTQFQLRLNHILKPRIYHHTKGTRRVGIGATSTFQCCISGFPPAEITWYKDKQPIMINASHLYTDKQSSTCNVNPFRGNGSTTSSTLTVRNASLSDKGNYQCMGSNYGGQILSANMTLNVGDLPSHAGLSSPYIGAIVAVTLVIIIVFIIVIICIKRSKPGFHKKLEQYLIQPQGNYNPDLPLDEQTGCLPYDPKWEFPKDRLRLGMILGQGAFGRVMKAEAVGIVDGEDVTVVAVKMVKDCTDKDQMMALLSELKILIHVGQHLNIVNLLGAVTKDIRFGELNVIVEYCHFGNLHNYLIKNRDKFKDTMEELPGMPGIDVNGQKSADPKDPYYVNKAGGPEGSAELLAPSVTTKNFYCWAFQVARGMEYLACKTYIHRDLAARNVLLAADNVVKICDFGLAKELYHDQYQKKGQGKVPVKWMALESFTHRMYTTKSDVWSYGILLWELFSLGGNPYPGIEINEKFISLLKSGYRMEKPQYANDDLYKVMLQTWKLEPEERPTFSKLVATMGDFLEANVKQHYLDLDPYLKMVGDEEEMAKEIPTDSDGYLTMAPYMEKGDGKKRSKDALNDSISELDETVPHYVNEKKWCKEKAESIELNPLISPRQRRDSIPDDIAPGFPNVEQSTQMHIVAEVHQPEDNDSGHSSSYEGSASSPVEADDYLVPITPGDHQATSSHLSSIDNPTYIGIDEAAPLLAAPPTPKPRDLKKPPRSSSGSAVPNDYRNLIRADAKGATPSSITPSLSTNDSVSKTPTSKPTRPIPNSLDAAIPRFHSNTKVYSQGKNNNKQDNKTPSSSSTQVQPPTALSAPKAEGATANVPPGPVNLDPKRNGAVPPRLMTSTSSSGYNSDMSPSEFSPPPDYRMGLEDALDKDVTM